MKSLFVMASLTIAATVLQAGEMKPVSEATASGKINQFLKTYEAKLAIT